MSVSDTAKEGNMNTIIKYAAVGALGLGIMAAALTPMIESQAHKITSQGETISQQQSDLTGAQSARDAAQKGYQTCLSAVGSYRRASASYELALVNISTEFTSLFDQPTFDAALASMKGNLADARSYSSVGEAASCR